VAQSDVPSGPDDPLVVWTGTERQLPRAARPPATEFDYPRPVGYTNSANSTALRRLHWTGDPNGSLAAEDEDPYAWFGVSKPDPPWAPTEPGPDRAPYPT
jgi:hypothetical protein